MWHVILTIMNHFTSHKKLAIYHGQGKDLWLFSVISSHIHVQLPSFTAYNTKGWSLKK